MVKLSLCTPQSLMGKFSTRLNQLHVPAVLPPDSGPWIPLNGHRLDSTVCLNTKPSLSRIELRFFVLPVRVLVNTRIEPLWLLRNRHDCYFGHRQLSWASSNTRFWTEYVSVIRCEAS